MHITYVHMHVHVCMALLKKTVYTLHVAHGTFIMSQALLAEGKREPGNHCVRMRRPTLPTKHGKPVFIPRQPCEGLKTNVRPIYLIEIPQTPSLFDDKAFLSTQEV